MRTRVLTLPPSPSLRASLHPWFQMVKERRVTFRRRHSYATRSNKIKVIRTPGGELRAQYRPKRAKGPSCGGCGGKINGIPALRPKQYSQVAQRKRTVSRAYGGAMCAKCVRARIVRAFLIEEQKIVKKVVLQKMMAKKAARE